MVAGFADDGQSYEAVLKVSEGGHNSISVLRGDDATLSHKGNQREVHTQLIVEEPLQGHVSTTNKRKLVCGDSHAHDQGDEEQHSYEVLINLDEELKLLEEMSEIEKFLIEHVFTDMEVDGVCNEATTMVKADQQDEGLMNSLENLVLHGERMLEASRET